MIGCCLPARLGQSKTYLPTAHALQGVASSSTVVKRSKRRRTLDSEGDDSGIKVDYVVVMVTGKFDFLHSRGGL